MVADLFNLIFERAKEAFHSLAHALKSLSYQGSNDTYLLRTILHRLSLMTGLGGSLKSVATECAKMGLDVPQATWNFQCKVQRKISTEIKYRLTTKKLPIQNIVNELNKIYKNIVNLFRAKKPDFYFPGNRFLVRTWVTKTNQSIGFNKCTFIIGIYQNDNTNG